MSGTVEAAAGRTPPAGAVAVISSHAAVRRDHPGTVDLPRNSRRRREFPVEKDGEAVGVGRVHEGRADPDEVGNGAEETEPGQDQEQADDEGERQDERGDAFGDDHGAAEPARKTQAGAGVQAANVMGLNLDVDHVAFAQLRKFDGHTFRDLTPPEMAQIAGRAGRHVRDGTFGVSARVPPLDDELVERIEGHEFDPLRVLQWRNRQLDFASIDALKASLDEPPTMPGLTRALPAVDQRALEFLSRDETVAGLCRTPAAVARLWDVCALPDYRKIAPAQHGKMTRVEVAEAPVDAWLIQYLEAWQNA